jgi:O-antigen ligase
MSKKITQKTSSENSAAIPPITKFYTKLLTIILATFVGLAVFEEALVGKEMTTATLGVGGFAILFLLMLRTKQLVFPKTIGYLLFSLVGWAAISSFFAYDKDFARWELLRLITLTTLFLVIYNASAIYKPASTIFLRMFTVISSLILFYDLYGFVASGDLQNGRYFIGSFFWHNQIAGFLLFLIPILVSFLLTTRSKFFKTFLFITSALAIAGFVQTYSRGAWLSFFGALVLFVFLYRKFLLEKKKTLFMVFILVAAILIGVSMAKKTQTVVDTIQGELTPQSRTVSGKLRLSVWENSLRIIKDNPIIGVGPGGFGSAYYRYQSEPWLYAKDAHNYFLQITAELGIVGLAIFTLLLFVTAYNAFKQKNVLTDISTNPLLSGVVIALFGSFLHTFIDFDWSIMVLFSLFFIFLAILVSKLTLLQKQIQLKGIKMLLLLLPIPLLLISFIMLYGEKEYTKALQFYREADSVSAQAHVEKAIKYNPYDTRYTTLLAETLLTNKKTKDSEELFKKLLHISPYHTEAMYNLGLMAFNRKDFKEAKKWFTQAIDTNPYSTPNPYLGLSSVYLTEKNDKKAEQILEDAIYKKFPLNDAYKGFYYLYSATSFNADLSFLYFRLVEMYRKENRKSDANKLLAVIKTTLDPKSPLLPLYMEPSNAKKK